jgi:hypothetical protein
MTKDTSITVHRVLTHSPRHCTQGSSSLTTAIYDGVHINEGHKYHCTQGSNSFTTAIYDEVHINEGHKYHCTQGSNSLTTALYTGF